MARLRSPEKRIAILEAATHEIAREGLGAATAKIAERAGVASGTLFTYFSSKEQLLNELYIELKSESYARMSEGFPHKASLERRAWHVWQSFLNWAIEFPEKRKVSMLLKVSDVVTAETRARASEMGAALEPTLSELEERNTARGLPLGFVAAAMSSMQDAVLEFVIKQPKKRAELVERSFQVMWRALK
jgi:AcrR family transcriptional regulator